MRPHLVSTPNARNRGPGGTVRLAAAALVAACLAAGPGAGVARAQGVAEAATGGSRHVVSAGAQVDTLDHPWPEVYRVAVDQLVEDDWGIQGADSTRRRIVTRWKPLKHRLARLAFGGILARCVVDLEPLPGGRTKVSMRGGLAAEQDLEASPFFGAAQGAYRKAATKFLGKVRARLDESRPPTTARLDPESR
jgi:hypothetical protein